MGPAKGASEIFSRDWSKFEPGCRARGDRCTICVDNRIACSKQATGHFPTDAEIIAAVT